MLGPDTKDYEIVDEDFLEMSQKLLEDVHHQSLEGSKCVTQSERHLVESKGSPFRGECCLQLVFGSDEHLVVSREPIKEAITLLSCHMIKDYIRKA